MKIERVIWKSQLVNIIIANGFIAEVEIVGTVMPGKLLDYLWVIPGVIDLHVHARVPDHDKSGKPKPEERQKEDWSHLIRAAARGGVTTMAVMPNTNPAITTIPALQYARSLVPADCPYRPLYWFGATPNNLGEIERAAAEPDVIGVKEFDGSSTGDLLVERYEDQVEIGKLCAAKNLPKAVHAENEALMRQNRARFGRPRLYDHPDIRSAQVEVSAFAQALRVGRETGCWVHLCHASTFEAADLAIAARQEGQKVSVEAVPHHWVLNRGCLHFADGGKFKMNPPLREEEERAAIFERLVAGQIDTVASDHAPHLEDEKGHPAYDDVPSGVPGVQTLLPLTLDLVLKGQMSLEELIRLTSGGPARIIGRKDLGVIAKGARADLVLIDPNKKTVISNRNMAYKCGWTPYDGMTTLGGIVATIIGGKAVYDVR